MRHNDGLEKALLIFSVNVKFTHGGNITGCRLTYVCIKTQWPRMQSGASVWACVREAMVLCGMMLYGRAKRLRMFLAKTRCVQMYVSTMTLAVLSRSLEKPGGERKATHTVVRCTALTSQKRIHSSG